jgi:F0F1-type ATP synthase gamma subunit
MAQAAGELIAYGPALLPAPSAEAPVVVVLIGAERGFCGGFNEDLLQLLREESHTNGGVRPALTSSIIWRRNSGA